MKEYAKGFYKSAAWKRARQQVITRSNGLCERCKARGIYKPGYIVHHKEYITPGNISNPNITLNLDNLEFAAIGSWFGARWTEIKTALASVPTWFKTQFDNAWTNIKNAFANVTSFFSDLWEKIKGCFVNVGVAIGSAVGDAFKSAINSCLSTIEGVVNKFIGMINGVIGIINEIPGVSLSKIDTLSLPRLAKGGVLREGTAMVAEAGPELLSMVNGKAVVTPLTGSAVNTAADNLKGNNSGFHQEINITSPKALSPYEVARQTRIQTRAMVIAMQRG